MEARVFPPKYSSYNKNGDKVEIKVDQVRRTSPLSNWSAIINKLDFSDIGKAKPWLMIVELGFRNRPRSTKLASHISRVLNTGILKTIKFEITVAVLYSKLFFCIVGMCTLKSQKFVVTPRAQRTFREVVDTACICLSFLVEDFPFHNLRSTFALLALEDWKKKSITQSSSKFWD